MRRIGVPAAVGLLVVAVAGCGSSTTEVAEESTDDPAAATDPSAQEPAVDQTTTTLPVGPVEVRLEGSRIDEGGTYEEVSFVSLEGACDGDGECSISRDDGALGYGVGGWDVDLELTDGTYAYEGVAEVEADACGEPLPAEVPPMQATLTIAVEPAEGATPTVTLTEAWSGLPPTDMSDGAMCSGLSATTFELAG